MSVLKTKVQWLTKNIQPKKKKLIIVFLSVMFKVD